MFKFHRPTQAGGLSGPVTQSSDKVARAKAAESKRCVFTRYLRLSRSELPIQNQASFRHLR